MPFGSGVPGRDLSRSAPSGRRAVRGRCGRLRRPRAEVPGRGRARYRPGRGFPGCLQRAHLFGSGPSRQLDDAGEQRLELMRGGGRHGVEDRRTVCEAIDAIEHQSRGEIMSWSL